MKKRAWFSRQKDEAKSSRSINSVAIVQQAVANPSSVGFETVSNAFHDIVARQLWHNSIDATGKPFESFGAFAIAVSPHGLGIRSVPAARLARYSLFEKRLFAPWTEILDLIARKPGNPSNSANSADCERFYTVGRTRTCRDRISGPQEQACRILQESVRRVIFALQGRH